MGASRPAVAALIAAALIVGACSSNPASTPTPVPTVVPRRQPPSPPDPGAAADGIARSARIRDGSVGSPIGLAVRHRRSPARPPRPTAVPRNPRRPSRRRRQSRCPPTSRADRRASTARSGSRCTFDADMYPFMYPTAQTTNKYDPRVIKLIEDNGLHATIFANGLYVKAFPDLIKELSKQPGIEIANHSWDHGAWPGCHEPRPGCAGRHRQEGARSPRRPRSSRTRSATSPTGSASAGSATAARPTSTWSSHRANGRWATAASSAIWPARPRRSRSPASRPAPTAESS